MTPPIPPVPPDDNHADAPPRDELDAMLREWHTVHADQARAGRDRLLGALAAEPPRHASNPSAARDAGARAANPVIYVIRRTLMNRYSPVAAAALIAMALLVSMLIPATTPPTYAGGVVLCPEGGRLDAVDADGNILGPCELTRTDVDVHISGFLTRVTLRQQYRNPHRDKIEAVYTFPMSHRSAVDRMTMTIGDRVVVGEVKEREAARQIYESARAQGRIASLLEQERPNIFTQSVANIEPGAAIDIEISYVELLEQSEGKYTFSFPTVVGPRYIPGTPSGSEGHPLPEWLAPRNGVVLLAPATVAITATGDDGNARPAVTGAQLARLLASSHASYGKGQGGKAPPRHPPALWHEFTATYPDGSVEHGALDADGTGHVNGRCFWLDPALAARDSAEGGGFAPNTNQVPDASRITPMPVKPPTRAGHDIGITVTIDTGGPAIAGLEAPLHEVVRTDERGEGEGAAKVRLALKDQDEIPNRDFVLSWSLAGNEVHESVFTHAGEHGGFFSLILQPPARVAPEMAVPRELIFVLDTSGSMSGLPIEKAKEVMSKSISAMRERDTFNIITFAGDTHILWEEPRPNTDANRAEAQAFLASRQGGGGTEMMKAIEAALRQGPVADGVLRPEPLTLAQLVELPADGREVTVSLPWGFENSEPDGAGVRLVEVRPGLKIRLGPVPPTTNGIRCPVGEPQLVTGTWATVDGERMLRPTSARWKNGTELGPRPLRLVLFMTDGYVGNDMAIIDAIRKHRATTRVFSLGVGDSINRFLLDGMAKAGAGEVEYVLLADAADAAVERLTRRISTPVLANINVTFSDGLKVVDVLPGADEGGIPDLFDLKPLVIHGRYTAPGSGTVTITGTTGAGPYTRTINLDLPDVQPANDTIATLWAREKVGAIMSRDLAAAQQNTFPEDLRRQVVTLGETFGIMTQYTSFVAVDRLRVTIGGEPRLVSIPIEMPRGVSWEGVFGEGGPYEYADADGDAMLDSRWFELGQGVPPSQAPTLGKRLELSPSNRFHRGEMQQEQGGGGGQSPFLPMRSIRSLPAERQSTLIATQGEAAAFAPPAPASAPAPAPAAVAPPPAAAGAEFGKDSDGSAAGPAAPEGQQPRDESEPIAKMMARRSAAAEEKAGYRANEGAAVDELQTLSGGLAPVTGDAAVGFDPELLFEGSPDDARLGMLLREDSGADGRRQVPVPPEYVAVLIARLAAADRMEEATKLAAGLAARAGDYPTGVSMNAALGDPTIDAGAKREAIAELGEAARTELGVVLRPAKLRQRLDPVLLPFAERVDALSLPDVLDAAYTGDKPAGATWKDGGVLVTILVKSADDAMLTAVRALGARVEHASPAASVVVAVVPLGRLDDLALLDGVRRVEPTRFNKR